MVFAKYCIRLEVHLPSIANQNKMLKSLLIECLSIISLLILMLVTGAIQTVAIDHELQYVS
jgi:hypothetical protein